MLIAVASMPLAQAAVEQRLVVVLIQLCVIIVAARVFATLFRRFGQPAVVGEIFAGLILGPSVFGRIEMIPALHGVWHAIFDPAVSDIFTILSQLGLIFLLFLIGLEFDFRHLKTSGGSSLLISAMGIAAPFAMGYGLARLMFPHLGLAGSQAVGFALFMGTAMSITAIPILGRIMMELNITRSRLGAVTITASAIDDASGWILLATVSALVQSHFRIVDTLRMLGLTVGFALLMMFVAKPLLRAWIRAALRRGRPSHAAFEAIEPEEGEELHSPPRATGSLGLNALAILFVVIFTCAIATSLIGIFAIFGAFILGAVLSDQEEFREAVAGQLREFVTVFFLPIFFTYTGLRTDVGSVGGGVMWLFAAAVTALAIFGKFGGCALAARIGGFNARESACIGVMMNTRALMELIVINVGYDLGVIPKSVFCMLVLMALITTVMTSPILLRLMRGTELEPMIQRSGFLTPAPA